VRAKTLAKLYGSLTPEERFGLIVAAGARGDEVEQERLVNAGTRIQLSVRDHAPYAHAFDELALMIYIELLEVAACYREFFGQADTAPRAETSVDAVEDDDAEVDDVEVEETSEAEPEVNTGAEADQNEPSIDERAFQASLAVGFVLRAKVDGWKLFCERLNIPPFALWEDLPGFSRLQRALALAEYAAFVPEGFLRWLNDVRPEGAAELTELPNTVEMFADAAEALFRKRVAWWGGR
jgi:hypothetical protein